MRRWIVGLCAAVLVGAFAMAAPAAREIAFVSNGEDGTVSLVDVAARRVVGVLDINPEHARGNHTGADNYAQDAKVSPDGRTLYVSRGYSMTLPPSISGAATCSGRRRCTRGAPTTWLSAAMGA